MNEATLRTYGFTFCQDSRPMSYFIIVVVVNLYLKDVESLSASPLLEDTEPGVSLKGDTEWQTQSRAKTFLSSINIKG